MKNKNLGKIFIILLVINIIIFTIFDGFLEALGLVIGFSLLSLFFAGICYTIIPMITNYNQKQIGEFVLAIIFGVNITLLITFIYNRL